MAPGHSWPRKQQEQQRQGMHRACGRHGHEKRCSHGIMQPAAAVQGPAPAVSAALGRCPAVLPKAPVTAGRIERLTQLLNRKLSNDFVSSLRDQELEWLVAKGFNSVEAFQAATVGALNGLAPGRAGALCAAFAGTSPSRTAPAASEVYSNITWLWPNNATGEYSEARLKWVSREFFVRRIVAQPIFVVPVSSKPEQILYCSEGVAVYSMDVVPMADGAILAVVPISRNSFFM